MGEKEDKIKAALLEVRGLIYPDLKELFTDVNRRRLVAQKMNETLVESIKALLDEIAEAENAQ
jgi:hypothetical protein